MEIGGRADGAGLFLWAQLGRGEHLERARDQKIKLIKKKFLSILFDPRGRGPWGTGPGVRGGGSPEGLGPSGRDS